MALAKDRLILKKLPSQGSFNIDLPASKSISNRLLLIGKLADEPFAINNLSEANDTVIMQKALTSEHYEIDVGHAGTAFRFLTAYLTLTQKEYKLTGSNRMQERPIGPLVDALIKLGADIIYEKKEGFPPIRIKAKKLKSSHTSISGEISSQYISALLMIGPKLPYGLELKIENNIASRPYINITLELMKSFGIDYSWNEANVISIKPQKYICKDVYVESDWSAASYWYGLVAISTNISINLKGLQLESLQGDQVISDIMNKFGVKTTYTEGGITINKTDNFSTPEFVELNFEDCPDLAQTVCVVGAILGVNLLISGIESLKIKETDRVSALRKELKKFNVHLTQLPSKFSKNSSSVHYLQEGKAKWTPEISVSTYTDHRMAMAFSLLSHLGEISIENPNVVKKSYPTYWVEWSKLHP